ncbi:kinase-like domain-containing protein [Hyaloraphidium curvatum]|nr:kinase-like domain-containing protein [Hyaloraphidium curvatum]
MPFSGSGGSLAVRATTGLAGASDPRGLPAHPAATDPSTSGADHPELGGDARLSLAAKFRWGRLLGRGSQSSVVLAHARPPPDHPPGEPHEPTPFAVKVIDKAQIRDRAHLRNLLREVRIAKTVRHPNVVRLFEAFETPQRVYLQFEYVAGGELYELVADREYLPEREARDVAWQLVDALAYLHGVGVVHRDLKLENVLVATSENGGLPSPAPSSLVYDMSKDSPQVVIRNPAPASPAIVPFPYPHPAALTVKLGDFGIATTMAFPPSSRQRLLQTQCGSFPYVAPEVLVGEHVRSYGYEVDLWSLGVSVFVMLSGRFPICVDESRSREPAPTLLQRLLDRSWVAEMDGSDWAGVSCEGKAWVSRCLEVDPQQRWSAAAARNDVWFRTLLEGDDMYARTG